MTSAVDRKGPRGAEFARDAGQKQSGEAGTAGRPSDWSRSLKPFQTISK